MSNIIVGDVYRQIIDRIVQTSQNDFEEGGYAPETLQDLKKIWQERLSSVHVAQMPWDPTPAQQAAAAAANQPQIKTENAASSGNGDNVTIKQESSYSEKPIPQIKYETPGYDNVNGYGSSNVNPTAQQRAANHLLQQFGPQANASIQAGGLSQQTQSSAQRPSQPGYSNGLSAAQTDGAADARETWNALVAETRANMDQCSIVDGMLKEKLQQQIALEDASLGLSKGKSRAQRRSRCQQTRGNSHILQTDGPDDDEDDEDAINSDLDDSDEQAEPEDDDEDGPLGEMILCTWDKVNRVKNKWKCTLKDGVLATGGKEYLFHKANGEFEW